ncbi:TRASH domain-containing protein [Bremerella alba]|uniref:Uncharacterized protein n=1 Tax=Bremerella alba TaxID=980252 RepID=A0A7V8V707_9BACT|nr:hypothetical protein [Bremerella alba]MBA2116118.1 hypothetical protein [Bremerella alba]
MKTFIMIAALLVTSSAVSAQAQELSEHDKIHIAVQDICPISGQKLGSMGTPIKVKVGEELVYVCCKGCLQQQVKPEHWATIHNNFAKAQGICPVMENKLSPKAKWTIVEGQIFYVCCPPCTEKIAKDPKAYLKKLDELYLASLRSQQR